MSDIKQLESLLSTQIPLVVVESHEEQKVINLLERVATLNSQGFYVWNLTHGLRRWDGSDDAATQIKRFLQETPVLQETPA